MPAQIRKYRLEPFSNQELPLGKILKVAFQNNAPHVWVEVDFEEAEAGLIQQVFTGNTGGYVNTTAWEYVDSAVSDELVWHLYKRKDS